MNDGQLQTVERVRGFLEGSEAVEFRGLTAQGKYCWVEEVLIRFKYHRLKRGEKGVIHRYIEEVTGYSRSQVSRLRPEHKDHAWSYDFRVDRTTDGRAFKILNIIDEFTRECLAILASLERFERSTRCLEGSCSVQLSYRDELFVIQM